MDYKQIQKGIGQMYSFIRDMIFFKRTIRNNIEIKISTNYNCNTKCDYCFSEDLIKKYKKQMPLIDLEKVLDWFVKNKIKIVHLLGGEPTIYKYFNQLLDMCSEKNLRLNINTNLLFDKKYLNRFDQDLIHLFVVHIRPRNYYTKKEWALLNCNLSYLSKKFDIILRHNILNINSPYEHIIQLAKKNNITKIRIAFIHDGINKKIFGNPLQEMKEMAPNLLRIIKATKKERIDIIIRKPLPLCAFSKKERKYLKKNTYFFKGVCHYGTKINKLSQIGNIDINVNPDLTFYACQVVNIKSSKKFTEYNNPKEIIKFFKKDFEELKWKPLTEECIPCKFRKKRLCQGGCLAFKLNR